MKKTQAILFVLILTIPFTGFYICLKYQKKIVRKEIKHKIIEGIDRKDLVYFAFTENEMENQLEWKHAKEFEYKGEMYDVVERISDGDTTHFWCWWDYEETKLNRELMNIVAIALGNNKTSREQNKQLQAFCKTLYCRDIWVRKEFEESREIKHREYINHYQAITIPPPNPPPVDQLA